MANANRNAAVAIALPKTFNAEPEGDGLLRSGHAPTFAVAFRLGVKRQGRPSCAFSIGLQHRAANLVIAKNRPDRIIDFTHWIGGVGGEAPHR